MKFSFRSFAIGFGCAALSLGAVTYANAAGNRTIKACANKTTGIMRYVPKGSCKKTETLLSWNQTGPQGLTGAVGSSGTKGDTGESGPKGDTGATGTAAPTTIQTTTTSTMPPTTTTSTTVPPTTSTTSTTSTTTTSVA